MRVPLQRLSPSRRQRHVRLMAHWHCMRIFGAVEAGGTKFVCGAGAGPDDLVTTQIATTSPEATVAAAVAWFRERGVSAIGIGSFGPVDLNPGSPTWGYIT